MRQSARMLPLPLPLALVVAGAALALPGDLPSLHCPLNATEGQCWSSSSTTFSVKDHGVNLIYEIDNIIRLKCNDDLQLDSVQTLRWLPQFTPALHVTNVSVTSCRPAHYATVLAALNVTLTSPFNLELNDTRQDGPVTGAHFKDLPPLRHLTLRFVDKLQLHGPLPSSLEGLTSLTVEHTSLWNNTILESPPRNLTELRLERVNITRVPAAVLNLPKLRSLIVIPSDTIFMVDDQVVINKGNAPLLKQLRVYFADGALLSKWAPPVLEEVTLLSWRALRPKPLPTCDKLVKLTLHHPEVTQFPPGWVARCPRLMELHISWLAWGLRKLPAKLMENATQLTRITISHTKLSFLPAGLFANTSNLTHLDVSRNQVQQLPEKLFANTPSLTRLDLSINQLKELPSELFASTTNLTRLDLNSNQVKELPAELFANTYNLNHCDVSRNQVQQLPAELFANTPNLTHLDLNHNQLKKLPPILFANTPNLSHLDLKDNKLKELPAELFANTPNLIHLELNFNRLTELPQQLYANTPKLTHLDLNSNELKELPKELFANTPNLTHLDLNSNELKDLPKELFANTPNLIHLDLSYNQPKELPAELFANTLNLTHLDLSHNQLKELPAELFANTSNLTHLDLSYNQLTQLRSSMLKLPLLWLDLGNNKFNTSVAVQLAAVTELRTLSLAANSEIGDLCVVDDTHVPGTTVHKGKGKSSLASLSKLERLELQNTGVTVICSDWREDMVYLRYLNLRYTKIASLTYEDLQYRRSVPAEVKLAGRVHFTDKDYNRAAAAATVDAIGASSSNVTVVLCAHASYDCKLLYWITKALNHNLLRLRDVQLGTKMSLITNHTENMLCPSKECNSAVPSVCTCGLAYGRILQILNIICIGVELHQVPRLPLSATNYTVDLILANNSITKLEIDHILPHLRILDLRNNSISSMTEETALALVSGVNRRVLLAGNRLACSCDTAPTLRVLRDHSSVVVGYDALRCEDGRTLKDAIDACWTLTAIVVTATLPTVTAAALAFCLWWKRRAVLGHGRALVWRLGWRPREDRGTAWTVDAFVMFGRGDETAALELTARLELNARRVLLAERDWLAPALLSECIAQSVCAARRTVALVSREWERSLETDEMQAAAYAPAVRCGALVLVLPPAGTPPAPVALRRYATDFPHLVLRRDAPDFWRRLERAVPSSAPPPPPRTSRWSP